ncbi:MAG: ATP synthase F1 subunit gamma [Phycisphaerae bacterium]
MAKARVIIKRRKAVRNIKKITKVMQMIATARYQKAYKRALGTKPYVKKIAELVTSVSESVQAAGLKIEHPLLTERPVKAGKIAVLVITSNRGLCGGYNGNILRLSNLTLNVAASAGQTPDLYVSGKKGIAYFKFTKRPMAETYIAIGDNPKFAEIDQLADKFVQQYIAGQIDGLKVVYMQFLSAGQQKAAVLDILPLSGNTALATDKLLPLAPVATVTYDFSPSPTEILNELIPTSVKVSLFQAFIEAAVSEQIARMVAMKAATDNAEKMTRKLTQDYNRARQSQITSELSELMGGVEALK